MAQIIGLIKTIGGKYSKENIITIHSLKDCNFLFKGTHNDSINNLKK